MNALAAIEQQIAIQTDGLPLPQNVEAEAALLGGLMQANNAIDRVADFVLPEHFFEPLHGRIYSAILAQYGQGRVANPVTLRPFFTDDEPMKELGGASYLAQLTGSGAAVIGVHDFAQQIFELAQLRALIGRLRKALEAAHDTSEEIPVKSIAAELETALAELTRSRQDGASELSGAQCIQQARDAITRQDSGVTSGIPPIDEAMGPIRKKNLAILAARPGMGKTATAISYSIGAARRGHGVLFVSLEMSAEEIGERMACDMCFDTRCQVPYEHVTSGRVNELEVRELARAQLAMDELPFQVIDVGSLPVHRLAMIVRRWKRRFAAKGQSLDLVVVDYLQKLRVAGTTNRFEVITEISQTLKEIAKENDVGLLALAQLSRKVEERDDKRPHMADLRESGQIEQDADAILFLLRPEYYLIRSEPPAYKEDKHAEWVASMDAVAGEIEFICAKRRKGREGTAKGRFHGAFQAVRGCHQ